MKTLWLLSKETEIHCGIIVTEWGIVLTINL